jgi:hypothetical protein
MDRLIKTNSTKQRPISKSTVTDKLDCGSTVPEALFAVRLVAYPRFGLGRLKNLVTLKTEAMLLRNVGFI